MKQLINQFFNELSVHGLSYIVKQNLQWLEKLLWLIVVGNATYYSVTICLDQWNRYISSPVALLVDRRYQNLKIPLVASTICAPFVEEERISEFIKNNISLNPEDEKIEFYRRFLSVLSNLNYTTPSNELEEFKHDKIIEGFDLLKVVVELKTGLLKNINKINSRLDGISPKITNFAAITENGLCMTNSNYHGYQNPFDENFQGNDSTIECYALYGCGTQIIAPYSDNTMVSIYFHDRFDIMASRSKNSLEMKMKVKAGKFILNVDVTKAENSVRNVPPRNRKCFFHDEKFLSYFPVYTTSLCLVECRIKVSLKSCGCRPFFYVVGDGPTCNISGMICALDALQSFNEKTCDYCLESCENVMYSARPFMALDLKQLKPEILVDVHMPNVVYMKRVIFSTDELLVSFGGTVSLFLGCSILTCAEIVFFIAEIVCKLLKNVLSKITTQ